MGGSGRTAKDLEYRNGRAHSFPVCKVTPVGIEPTPLRNGALSHRLRPLGQTVLNVHLMHVSKRGNTSGRLQWGVRVYVAPNDMLQAVIAQVCATDVAYAMRTSYHAVC